LRKILTISTIVLLLLVQFGAYIVYLSQAYALKEKVKAQIKSGIPAYNLTTVAYEPNKSKIQWEEAGKEFYLDGKLYDIVEIKTVNGKTFFYTLPDTKEDELVKRYLTGQDKNPNNNKQIIKLIVLEYEYTAACFNKAPVSFYAKSYSLFKGNGNNSPYLNIVSPPPQNG
jgi:hypothetical protein